MTTETGTLDITSTDLHLLHSMKYRIKTLPLGMLTYIDLLGLSSNLIQTNLIERVKYGCIGHRMKGILNYIWSCNYISPRYYISVMVRWIHNIYITSSFHTTYQKFVSDPVVFISV